VGAPGNRLTGGLAREAAAWLRAVPGWSAERRSRAVALGALLLLLIALVMILVARFTVGTRSAPPQVGGADQHTPGFAVVPGQTGDPLATASAPGSTGSPVAQPGGPSTGGGGSGLTGAYRTIDTWVGGYRGEVTVTNPAAWGVDGWTVTVTLPPLGLVVDSVHGAQSRQTAKTVTFTPVDATRSVAPGGSVRFDFAVNGVGVPSGCTVDGRPCTGIPG
jgi:Cellulose binding domain